MPTPITTLPILPVYGGDSTPAGDVVYDSLAQWEKALPCGAPRVYYPFQDEGDTTSFILYETYEQLIERFTKLALSVRHPDAKYNKALLVEETQMQDQQGLIGRWDRVYATIPKKRRVPESFLYSFQLEILVSGQVSLVEKPFSVNSYVEREYFLRSKIASFPLSLAPRLDTIGADIYKRGTGDLHLSGSFVVSSDAEILAEDDVYEHWKGDIMCRKRRLIKGPTVEFWGEAT